MRASNLNGEHQSLHKNTVIKASACFNDRTAAWFDVYRWHKTFLHKYRVQRRPASQSKKGRKRINTVIKIRNYRENFQHKKKEMKYSNCVGICYSSNKSDNFIHLCRVSAMDVAICGLCVRLTTMRTTTAMLMTMMRRHACVVEVTKSAMSMIKLQKEINS